MTDEQIITLLTQLPFVTDAVYIVEFLILPWTGVGSHWGGPSVEISWTVTGGGDF